MKRLFPPGVLLVSLILSVSCSDKYDRDGDWDDCIKLSRKNLTFEATADSAVITTVGQWWWVTDVSVNNVYFCGFEGVETDSEHYVIRQDCFTIERRDAHTLFIKLDANLLSSPRSISVGLQAGDYFDRVSITQKAASKRGLEE
jgi:hypothetical protein